MIIAGTHSRVGCHRAEKHVLCRLSQAILVEQGLKSSELADVCKGFVKSRGRNRLKMSHCGVKVVTKRHLGGRTQIVTKFYTGGEVHSRHQSLLVGGQIFQKYVFGGLMLSLI
jgi:hypothetical protein